VIVAWLLACTAAEQPVERAEEVPVVEEAPAAEVPPQVEPEPTPPPEPEPEPDLQRPPPDGWVDLAEHVPGIVLDIRYHTADNFTGAPLPGYGVPGAWMLQGAADALKAVQHDLQAKGLGLIVYDAYRPLRGTKGMVAWAERTDQVHLLDNGYVARRSQHNKGTTIDLSVIDAATGEPLDMGTPWDTLSEASHTTKATGEALNNRLLLREVMHAHGYKNYWKEWWHYTWKSEAEHPHRDVPYSCFEPDEGAWVPPEGWNQPGFVMPAAFEPQPCP
jgi:D-alanyl-D-alanine dipeptidase